MEPQPAPISVLATRFASDKLGPMSAAWIARPESLLCVEESVASGKHLEDAVLKQVFAGAQRDRGLASEFFSYILFNVFGIAKDTLAPKLRRMVDTGDLLDSVMGGLWERLRDLQFETRAQFVRLVAQALRWKAGEYDRRMKTQRRRGDLQAPGEPEDYQVPNADQTPSSRASQNEERELLPRLLEQLSPKDQDLLRRYLQGATPAEIAESSTPKTTEGAVQKALERALQRARELGFELD